MSKLSGKVAVVTGAGRGIGAAIAKRLAADGAQVVVNYASRNGPADEVVAAVRAAGGAATAVRADVSDPAQVAALFAAATNQFSRVDILVNNAGVADMRPLDHIDPDHVHKLFDLNVLGLLLCCRAAAGQFGPAGGVIVNVSSNITRMAFPGAAVYTATKAAVDAVTRVLAAELGPKNVRVNSVCPGFTETDLNKDMDAGIKDQILHRTPLGRHGRPDDIADVVAFLASADARWVTGEMLGATGGLGG